MSASQQIPPPEPEQQRRSRRQQSRTVAVLILAVGITLFAVLNLKEVQVDWIVGSGHAPLIIVIAIALLVGVVIGHFAERRGHFAQRRAAKRR
jgi:uncharacterized integral membrane protein